MSPEEIVTNFCKSIESDPTAALELLDENCFYHNIPMEPIEGIDNIKRFFAGFAKSISGLRFEVLNQVTSGNVVMNERIDYFVLNGQTKESGLPVTGVFENKNGKISSWRDYFDLKTMEKLLDPGN